MTHRGRRPLVLGLLAASLATLLGGSLALVAPPPGAAARTTRTHMHTILPPPPGRSERPTDSAPRRREAPGSRAKSSALRLGFNINNNNDNNNGGGGANMDPGLKLLVCILIDFVGVASFAAPGLGEATDAGWAPVSALLVNYLFGNGLFTALALVEELSPGLDFVPTATIAWFLENSNRESRAPPPPPPSSPPRRASPSGRPADNPDVIDVDVIN